MKTVKTILIVLVVVAFGLEMRRGGMNEQLYDMRQAYKICMAAHGETNGRSEQACGDAQDKTSTEFNCNQAGYCWLEVK